MPPEKSVVLDVCMIAESFTALILLWRACNVPAHKVEPLLLELAAFSHECVKHPGEQQTKTTLDRLQEILRA